MKTKITVTDDTRGKTYELAPAEARELFEALAGIWVSTEQLPSAASATRLVDEPYAEPQPPQKATKATKVKREKREAAVGDVQGDVLAYAEENPGLMQTGTFFTALKHHRPATVRQALTRLAKQGKLKRTGKGRLTLWSAAESEPAPQPAMRNPKYAPNDDNEKLEAMWRDKNLPATARIDALRRLEDRGAITSETYANRRSLILSEG